jgi:hypothetical protein
MSGSYPEADAIEVGWGRLRGVMMSRQKLWTFSCDETRYGCVVEVYVATMVDVCSKIKTSVAQAPLSPLHARTHTISLPQVDSIHDPTPG